MDSQASTFYFIPHTHWEGAVFKTRAEYLDMGLPNILRALRLLKLYPAYRFVLDQSAYVQPFLERYPEERAAFQQFIDEGRLVIAGGMLVMPDENMPGGESFVRQIMIGKRYFRRTLNVDVTSCWPLDTFGHHAQIPQLMKLAGYKSFWFFRGVASWDTPAEFIWEGLDGSRIPVFWLAHGYAVTYGSPHTLPEFSAFFKERYELLAPFARGADRVGLAGADVCEPEEQVPALIDAFNAQADAPFTLRISTPAEYEARAEQMQRPVIGGELNPIFQGIYSSRIEVKQQTREIERLLTTAEKQGAVLQWLRYAVDDAPLWQAWDHMLFNQTHDLMSGVMTDHVFDDTMHSFAVAREVATMQVESRLRQITARVDTQGEGIPVTVFNTLGWTRTDVAQVQIAFTDADVHDVQLVDDQGALVSTQITQPIYNNAGGLLQATLVFIARDIPPMGYAVFHARAVAASSVAGTVMSDNVIENELYRMELDLATGAITRMTMRSDGREVLKAPANIVAMEPDHGDLWEPYHPLDGGSRIAMQDVHGVPQGEGVIFSNQQTDKLGAIQRGAVFSELTVTHPFSAQGKFSTTIRAYANLPRVEIHTRILNNDSFVRYRALFPSTITDGQLMREIPFGAYTQPTGIEFPAQHWVDYSDGEHGLAVLNRGLPGNNVADDTLLLSLLRCSAIVAYGFGGGYEPGMSSDSGQELGKTLALDYALIAHDGDWRDASIVREGWTYNHPLIARTAEAHAGDLPSRWGLLAISHPNVLLTALKPGSNGTIVLRVYEAEGRAAEGVRIRFGATVRFAENVNLLEDDGEVLDVMDDAVLINLRPFEIRTLKLQLAQTEI